MRTHVDMTRRDLPWRRRIMVIRKTKRHVVVTQQVEDVIRVPALVAEFERVGIAAGQHFEERLQPLAILFEARRELKQHDGDFRCEGLEPRFHQSDRVFRFFAQPFPMRDEFRRLPREQEGLRRLVAPTPHGRERRRPVERAVDLGGRKLRRVPGEPILLRHLLGIERPTPAVIGPTRRADEGFAHCGARLGKLADMLDNWRSSQRFRPQQQSPACPPKPQPSRTSAASW